MMLAYNEKEEIQALFSEYTDLLIKDSPEFSSYLKLQNYDAEVEHLADKYGLPDGRLYLARMDGRAAGCIALRKLDRETCEMKRLYVRPEFRGRGIAEQLVKTIIDDAGSIGYRAMLLDTLPFLREAIHLYRKLGFYEVKSYNNSPMDTLIYLRLDLKP
jgi:ribosomal protein S18 acetylase RimI-like enzyme